MFNCCRFIQFEHGSSAQQVLLVGMQHNIASRLVTVQPARPRCQSHMADSTSGKSQFGKETKSGLMHNQHTPCAEPGACIRYSLALNSRAVVISCFLVALAYIHVACTHHCSKFKFLAADLCACSNIAAPLCVFKLQTQRLSAQSSSFAMYQYYSTRRPP